jgi:hypothetical protein
MAGVVNMRTMFGPLSAMGRMVHVSRMEAVVHRLALDRLVLNHRVGSVVRPRMTSVGVIGMMFVSSMRIVRFHSSILQWLCSFYPCKPRLSTALWLTQRPSSSLSSHILIQKPFFSV